MIGLQEIMPVDEKERSFWRRFYALKTPVLLNDFVREPDCDETPLSQSEVDFCISRGIHRP